MTKQEIFEVIEENFNTLAAETMVELLKLAKHGLEKQHKLLNE